MTTKATAKKNPENQSKESIEGKKSPTKKNNQTDSFKTKTRSLGSISNRNLIIGVIIVSLSILTLLSISVSGYLAFNYRQLQLKFINLEEDVKDSNSRYTNVNTQLNTLTARLSPVLNQLPEPKPDNVEFITPPDLDSEPWKGNPRARYTWFKYSDPNCPFCGRINPDLDKLVTNNPDLNLVFRHYPLTQIHPEASDYAHALECSHNFGGNEVFWPMLDEVYNSKATLNTFATRAADYGGDTNKIKECMDSSQQKEVTQVLVEESNNLLAPLGHGTPTGIIYDSQTKKNIIVVGALPYDQLQTSYDNFVNAK